MKENMKISLGIRVKILREQAKLTQEKLSEDCGVSWRTISNLERGVVTPDIKLLQSIAQRFHISLDELLSFDAAKEKSKVRLEKELRIYELVKSMSNKMLDYTLEIVDTARRYFK